MSPQVCFSLMLGSYFLSFSGAMAYTRCTLKLTFCDANIISHNFCDILPVFQLSCTSTYINDLMVFIVAAININVPPATLFIAYGGILSSIHHISFNERRSKAFGTCSSHIIAVSLFFVFSAFMYLKSSSAWSMDEGKFFSVFYMNVLPMMSSLIYSL
uniref:olfactory receptor 8B8-like n=1 Tax=Callithrix jacchus TaxID=9483 RepID=UPI0023DCFB04|nr:olfactory receptor 8B8-like [Callithrix jacchus]